MSDIVITGSGRLWCRDCDAVAKAADEGWGGDLIVIWIRGHVCTDEDLAQVARDAVMERSAGRFLAKFNIELPPEAPR